MPIRFSKARQQWYNEANAAREKIDKFIAQNHVDPNIVPDVIGAPKGRVTQRELNRLRTINTKDWIVRDDGAIIIPNAADIMPPHSAAPRADNLALREVENMLQTWENYSPVAQKYVPAIRNLIANAIAEVNADPATKGQGRAIISKKLADINAQKDIYDIVHYVYDGPGPLQHYINIVSAIRGDKFSPPAAADIAEETFAGLGEMGSDESKVIHDLHGAINARINQYEKDAGEKFSRDVRIRATATALNDLKRMSDLDDISTYIESDNIPELLQYFKNN